MLKKYIFLVLALLLIISLSPITKASSYPSGSLLALENTPSATVYYIGEDNQKYAFPDSKTYFTYYDNFDDVIRVNLSTLDSYPDGGVMPYRAGTKLITHQNTAKVYAVEPNGLLRWIPTEQIAVSLYGSNWATRVQDVIPGFFSTSYSLGSDLSDTLPNGTIVRVRNTNTYYYIENGQKIVFTGQQNYNSEDIVEVDNVANYPDSSQNIPEPTPTPEPNPTPTPPPDDGSGSGSDTPEPTPTPTPPPVDNDSDNDGYDSVASGGNDCNDSSATIHPGATDVCGDSIDQDCSGADLSCPVVDNDSDNDGYDSVASGGNDCNDSSATIHPGATEIANDGIDQDCSGADLVSSTSAQRLVFEDFEDSDWTDNFSRAVNEINVSMSSDVAMGSVSSRMYGGSLGASFDYIFADHGLPNVQDGDKYYIKYYTYYDESLQWDQVDPYGGWKQLRTMPDGIGWPVNMFKFGNGHPALYTHSYYAQLSFPGVLDETIDVSPPSYNEWHLHELILSYGNNSGGFAWYIDGELYAGLPLVQHTLDNLPMIPADSELGGFRIAGGNGMPPGGVYYVDNIEIWKGIPY
ncbi:hypothetical protein C4566_02290 [Candidatus Parcubacteria bacterium]|nr:MAG: hypothetical protein C4566_02290 [Candidatus Parcubacteria bacterium]